MDDRPGSRRVLAHDITDVRVAHTALGLIRPDAADHRQIGAAQFERLLDLLCKTNRVLGFGRIRRRRIAVSQFRPAFAIAGSISASTTAPWVNDCFRLIIFKHS